ncbi:MAG: GSU2204 family CXXCH-containing (seleno)protein [Candidatus Aminicenantes bacterium]
MKKALGIILCLSLVTIPLSSQEKDEDEKKTQVKASVAAGAVVHSNDGNLTKVGEYRVLPDGVRPIGKADVRAVSEKIFLDLNASYNGDPKDQDHMLDFNAGRVFDQKFSYTSLLHRLDHDPLKNLDVASEARSGVFHEDFNPTDEYQITRSEFVSKSRLTIPGASFLKIYANIRNEHRSGEYQARTLSKCSSCHVVAKSRPISNNNTDYQLGGNVTLGKAVFDYSYTKREYRENEAAPTNTYLLKLHPEKVIPVFDSRIQYDARDGALPFNVVPDTDKQTHLIKANVPLSDSSVITAHYVNSNVKNAFTNLTTDSNSFAGGFSTRIGKGGLFNARFRQISIKNDSVFIDTVEPVDVAGPNVGKTFVEAYPDFGSADWERLSVLNRKTWDFDASFKYRFSLKTKLRLNYDYERIDRDHYEISTTNTHTITGYFDYKPVRQWKFVLKGVIKITDNPFTNLYAGVAPLVQDFAVDNPFSGNQFYVFHRAREAHLTSLPTDMQEVKGIVTWNPNFRFSLSADIRLRSEQNDKLNFSTWENDTLSTGFNIWWAPLDGLDITGTYYFYGEKLSSLFAIPVLEGCGGGIIGGFPGTLTDQMKYDIDTHTAFLNLNYAASENFSLFGSLTYNNSLAEMSDITLGTDQLDFIPAVPVSPFDFDGISETVEYSNLKMKQIVTDMGASYALNETWSVKGVVTYYLYDDMAQYLFVDTGGNSLGFYLAAVWNF